jgi:MoaA/NifB/PqqE/SkfB family radical SAM enzyme
VAERYYTTSTAFLEALAEAGVRHVQIHLDTAAVEVRRVVTARPRR